MPTRVNALVVMAKAPVAGTVKTRLVPPFSFEEAAALYRCLFLDQLDNLTSLSHADLFVAFSPDGAASFFKEKVPAGFVCFPQQGEDLGDRMHHAFLELSEKGYGHIVLIGSDVPVFPARFLEEAFETLKGPEVNPVVLGPSRDGGYYLIGMNGPNRQIFEGVPWSTSYVLPQTVRKLTDLGLKPHLLPAWFDIDTLEDIRYLVSIADQTSRGSQKNTLSFLNQFRLRGIEL